MDRINLGPGRFLNKGGVPASSPSRSVENRCWSHDSCKPFHREVQAVHIRFHAPVNMQTSFPLEDLPCEYHQSLDIGVVLLTRFWWDKNARTGHCKSVYRHLLAHVFRDPLLTSILDCQFLPPKAT